MGKKGPRRGSLAFWHRKRASGLMPRVHTWGSLGKGLEGFPGFKVGMTHVVVVDDRDSPTKGQEIVRPVTLVEVPPLFVYSIVGYKNTVYGSKRFIEVPTVQFPKQLSSSHTIAKKAKKTLADFEKLLPELSDVRVIACTQPYKVPAIGTKQADFFELGLGGKDAAEKFAAAKELVGKEVSISQVFKEGEFFDAIGVTKGFGWQGVVARFGVALNPRKATKSRRHGGSIGAETPAKVMYTVPRAGQSGFHRRTERMKRIYSISNKPTDYSQNSCFPNYGKITNDFIVVEGSLSGPAKRVLFLRKLLYETLVKKPEVKEIVKVVA